MIEYSVERFKDPELEELAKLVTPYEGIDYGCEFVVARNGEVCGVAGVNFTKELYPRFEHIIVTKRYQKGKLGAILCRRIDKLIKERGYNHYIAVIQETSNMHHYAIKFGMTPFKNDRKGIWYYKEV